jgi:hypothetical protein
MMKKILLALGFAVVATSASASGLSVTADGNAVNWVKNSVGDGSDGVWGGDGSTLNANLYAEGYVGQTGTLKATQDGFFVATFLGKVAAFDNMYVGGSTIGNTVGATAGIAVTADQAINFSFKDGGNGTTFANGASNTATQGILYFDATAWNAANGTAFDFLIGYNDSAPINHDFDDYVVGVVNQVPVPAALPLMASALGAFGVSRRKSKAKAA